MAETLQAVGKLVGITEKTSGWHTIEIDVGGKYSLKLDTKREENIAAARATSGEVATWTYDESDGNPNPHKPGTFYKNRYLEGVELGGVQASTSTAGGKPDVPPEVWEAKERRDFRSRAWGQVLGATEHLISKDDLEKPSELFARLHPLQRLIYHDIVRNLDSGEGVDDSDIPF